MIRKRFTTLLLLFCVCTQALASEDRSLFWEVSSAGASVYLLGSIHFADDSFYPLRKEIEHAFEKADNLVVELDMTTSDIGQYRNIMASEGVYAGEQTIRDHISAKTYEQLMRRLQQLGIAYEQVSKQKPGILVMNLTSVQVMKMGFDPALGIDYHFLNRARGQKNIIALETIEQQMRIFLDIADGDLFLQESLSSMDEAEALMQDMITLWKQGDVQALNKLLFEDTLDEFPGFASIYDKLFYQRNRNMVAAIKGFLNSSESYFVVVGAGHLIGEQGIISLLQQAGYVVKRL